MATVVVTEPMTSGLVLLKTSIGDIMVELWPKEAPKAVRNFVQLCLEGFYDGLIFHRVVPNFIAQTGDPTGTGQGGDCIYDEGMFADEFNQRLKFSRRGLVAMANQGTRNSNLSQFFFTLDRTDELQNRNTIFGRIQAGDTLFNLLKLNEIELEPGSDRPLYPPTITRAEVLDNPFPDIVPRITAQERKEQDRAKKEMKLEKLKQKEQGKRKATKNKSLLSFGAEPEEEVIVTQKKFTSSHDALDDPRLKKQVLDDRGTSATLPPELMAPPVSSKKERPDERPAQPSTSKLEAAKLVAAKEAKSKSSNQNDKLQADIAKVQADIKKMTKASRGSDSDSSSEEGESKRKSKKAKRSGPSLLQLEREKYNSKTVKGKKGGAKREEVDLLDVMEGFKNKVLEAKMKDVEEDEEKEETGNGYSLWDDGVGEEDDDEDWLSHKLVFRKDATLDRHNIDEYSTYDPLSKNSLSLDELKTKADNAVRKYPNQRDGDRGSSSRGGGGGRESRDQRGGARDRDGGRGGGSGSGGGYRGSGREGGSSQYGSGQERPEVRGSSWKQDRVSTNDLA